MLINCSSSRIRPTDDWRTKCRDLLELLWLREDSTPFREPVDLIEHPGNLLNMFYLLCQHTFYTWVFVDTDYLASVDTPMDLRTIKEDLLGGNYETINEFVKDMRLIFSNSRNYNTNKRSRVRFCNTNECLNEVEIITLNCLL